MKRHFQIITSAVAASALTFAALAEDRPEHKTTDRPNYNREGNGNAQRTDRFNSTDRLNNADRRNSPDRLNAAEKASDIIGLTVKNYQGEKLGQVDDLAIDLESGRIVQVILSSGGFIGVGDTMHAVPPAALHHDVANKVIHLDADKAKLNASPKFEMSKWAECCDSEHVTEVYRHYGEQPYFAFTHREQVENAAKNRDRTVTPATKGRPTDENRSDKTWSRLGTVQKASKLMGMSVKNNQAESLGEIKNLMVDLSAGRVVAVILSSGGFLGMGDEMSAVPPNALRFNPAGDALQLDATKELLSSAPHFKADQWPDFGQPAYTDGVYRAYKVDPYFTTNSVPDADNTARNVRDRNNRTLTPLDQSNSKTDVNTTAQIRKGVNAMKDVSVNARNVKIITADGRVTLRGPVNTAQEKLNIGEIAAGIAQSVNVDNQLEVR